LSNEVEIRQMWPDGPSRNYSTHRPGSSWIPLADGGYGGPYVCQSCKNDVIGIYRVENVWQCAACRRNAKFRRINGKAGQN